DKAETQMWRYQNDDKYRDPEKFPSESPSPATPTPSPDSSTASMPPAAPACAPSRPSNNSRPNPLPPRSSNQTRQHSIPRLYPLHPKPLLPKLASFFHSRHKSPRGPTRLA